MNQCKKASQERTTSSNLTDMGWVAVHTRTMAYGKLPGRLISLTREATVKVYGVAVAKPQGHSWAPNLLKGSR